MPSRPRAKTIAALAALLILALPIGLTGLTAHSTREALRAQIGLLQSTLPSTAPALVLERLDGGVASSRLALRLTGPLPLVVEAQLRHRLLSSHLSGALRRAGRSGTPPLATLEGRIDYRPWADATRWELALRGRELGPQALAGPWYLAPWHADLRGGDEDLHLSLDVPRLTHEGLAPSKD
jgi:hypothetical protein